MSLLITEQYCLARDIWSWYVLQDTKTKTPTLYNITSDFKQNETPSTYFILSIQSSHSCGIKKFSRYTNLFVIHMAYGTDEYLSMIYILFRSTALISDWLHKHILCFLR